MDDRLAAALPWLLEIAKKKEFPDSVFAVEAITDVLWDMATASGDSDPESSDTALQACTKLGMSYEEILNLQTDTLKEELNSRLANAKSSLQDLWFALCMVTANKLAEPRVNVIDVDWSLWEQHNPSDMVQFPYARSPLMQSVPYPILNLLLVHYGPGAFDLDKLFAEVEHQLKTTFTHHREMFVMQKLTTTPS